jgi:hypothetical protein
MVGYALSDSRIPELEDLMKSVSLQLSVEIGVVYRGKIFSIVDPVKGIKKDLL